MTQEDHKSYNEYPQEDPTLPKHETGISVYGRVTQTFGPDLLHALQSQLQGRGGEILDNGISSGEGTIEIALLFPSAHVTGIDIRQRAVNLAKERENEPKHSFSKNAPVQPKTDEERAALVQRLTWKVDDGYFPHFPENSFDIVFMMNMIYQVVQKRQLSSEQLAHILQNQFAILKPGGFLCISGTNLIRNPEVGREDDMSIHPFLILKLDENKKPIIFAEWQGTGEEKFTDKGMKEGWITPSEVFTFFKKALGLNA